MDALVSRTVATAGVTLSLVVLLRLPSSINENDELDLTADLRSNNSHSDILPASVGRSRPFVDNEYNLVDVPITQSSSNTTTSRIDNDSDLFPLYRRSNLEILQKVKANFDPYALAIDVYQEEWSEFLEDLGLPLLNERNVRDAILEHLAYNLELSHLLANNEIDSEEFRDARRPMQELQFRLRSILSPEQAEAFWDNHLKHIEAARLERKSRTQELVENGETGIIWAAGLGDMPTLEAYIGSGVDVNATTIDGARTPLINAVRSENLEIVQALINAGADVNQSTGDDYNDSPLQWATLEGNIEIIRFLVAAGADLEYSNPGTSTNTALNWAALTGDREVVQELLSLGAYATGDAGVLALKRAIELGDQDMESMLINAGADEKNDIVKEARALRKQGFELGLIFD